MKRPSLANERGEIAIAALLSIVALISGLSMSMIAGRDANSALHQLDQVQQLSLLRSDIRRGEEANSFISSSVSNMDLPVRYVQINSGLAQTTYAIKTKIGRAVTSGGLAPTTRRGIRSLVRAFRTPVSVTNFYGAREKSPVETYGQKTVRKQTFAGYMYLTNTDESVNGDEVKFWGWDELWGRVHSNTDIWCQMGDGRWPLFHGHVSTGGVIQYENGSPNPDELFLDGYTEHAPIIDFAASMDPIRRNGTPMWPEYDIAFVTLDNNNYRAQLGLVHEFPPDTLIVYDLYPPFGPVGDSIGYNVIALRETLWTQGGSSISDDATYRVMSPELWIEGQCDGAMTWGVEGDMKLVSDITYAHTPLGEAPDGSDGGIPNNSDFLGLVADGDILIQYGYKDPVALTRHHPNCDQYQDGIYIYAALAAIGNGHGDSHADGTFSFEYQYPHQATPNTWMGGEYFEHVDLHLGKYPDENPPFGDWPWPAKGGGGYSYADLDDPQGPDYPWYNPLWPEWLPIRERGVIHLYGSVAQTRRGFVHRSGRDPLDTGWWDLEDSRYGPSPAWGPHAPGTPADKNGVGYDKDYHYDHRFIENPPPNFPEVGIVGGESQYEGVALRFQRPPRSF